MALLRGNPYQQEWTLFWELSLQKLSLKNHCKEWALPERALTAGGCGGGPRLSEGSLQSGGGGRPCQGALTARRWGEEHYRGCCSAEGRAPPGRETGARKKRNWARES